MHPQQKLDEHFFLLRPPSWLCNDSYHSSARIKNFPTSEGGKGYKDCNRPSDLMKSTTWPILTNDAMMLGSVQPRPSSSQNHNPREYLQNKCKENWKCATMHLPSSLELDLFSYRISHLLFLAYHIIMNQYWLSLHRQGGESVYWPERLSWPRRI